jgi:hypothetical protein
MLGTLIHALCVLHGPRKIHDANAVLPCPIVLAEEIYFLYFLLKNAGCQSLKKKSPNKNNKYCRAGVDFYFVMRFCGPRNFENVKFMLKKKKRTICLEKCIHNSSS